MLMPAKVWLATYCHDPEDTLASRAAVSAELLTKLFYGIVVRFTDGTDGCVSRSMDGAVRLTGSVREPLGLVRKRVTPEAYEAGADCVVLCDFDRALHWSSGFIDELVLELARLPSGDITVYGRSRRVMRTHPPMQRLTEGAINDLFSVAAGYAWDVTAGARAFSRLGIERIVMASDEMTRGVDCVWPLRAIMDGGLSFEYREVEGLEYEDNPARTFGASVSCALGEDGEGVDRQSARRLFYAKQEAEAICRLLGVRRSS